LLFGLFQGLSILTLFFFLLIIIIVVVFVVTEVLNDLYSRNIVRMTKSRKMRWAGHVARMGERRGIYRVSVGKHEEKRPLGRARRKWEDNIKIDLQEVGCGSMDWIELAHDRDGWRTLVNAVNPHNIRFTARCKDSPLPIAVRVSVSQLCGPVQRIATGWKVRGSNPDEDKKFHNRPDRPWGSPNLYTMGTGFISWG